ncbi:MAG: radical SAM family heme chaperone HemW, partial [Oscillospiraceae bacterium]
MAVGLYFHIPFCMRKCPYCDFYSLVFSEEMQDEFTAAVVRNILSCGGESVDTIYFGGGTPSLLSAESYVKIFKAISDNFKLESPEISLEANPGTIDYNKLKRLRELGFNRISFGVQSLSDNELSALGRIHTSAQAENAVILAKSAGFENISADIILGLIGQDENSLSSTIDRLCSLPVSHISAYMLKIEKNTPFNSPEIIRQLPDDEKTADIYLFAAEKLEKNGFLQYEISNFSKPGLECRHNLKYWRCEEYIGIGPSAHSYFNNKRYFSP